jgi:flagellar hook-length control protein FliK
MTMQTTTLPFQVSGANAAPQRPGNLPGASADGGQQFGATLSREIAQRQPQAQAAPSPAPNKPATPNKAASGEKSSAAQAQRQNSARDAAKPADAQTAKAGQAATAETAQTEESTDAADAAAAAAAAATAPVTDMLAYMASLAQPAAQAIATEATQQPAAATSELQLAALQTAVKNLGLGEGVATLPQETALPQEEAASTGFSLATGVQAAPTELLTTQDAAAAAQAKLETPAQMQAQLREIPQQAPAPHEEPAPSVAQLQAQAAKLETVQAPANGADRIPARVGTPGWDNQVSQRIVYMIGKEQAATLTLNPPDLGPVQVVLNVSNDQATVAFSSSELEVRQALENAIPRLREMMEESGIALGNATVDAGTPDQRQANGSDGERRGNGNGSGWAGDGRDDGKGVNEAAPRATRSVAIGDRGMVDTFA